MNSKTEIISLVDKVRERILEIFNFEYYEIKTLLPNYFTNGIWLYYI